MKKLMITMVALASGLAAWTANAAGDGSQGSSWVASDKTADTWNGDSLWKSDTEGLLDNAEKVSFVYDETDTSKNCLTLSTGTDIVKRAINADELYTVSQGQYYFDVNMDLLGQALDTVPTLSDDDKFALFLLDCDEFKDSMSSNQWVNVKGTNLCAIALDPKTNNKILLVYNQNSASSLFGGGDSRVTIQAYADVTGNADAPVPGFVVYLNGNSASETSPLGIEYVVPYDKDNSAPAWANLKSVGEYSYLVGKIASSLNQKRLKIAMSLVGGTNGQKMKGLSFAGNAEISSVAMQVDAPIKIEEDSKTVTVKCKHVTVAVETDGFTYEDGKLSGTAGQTCTFSVTPEEGYPVIKVIGDVTLAEDGKYTYTYVEGDEISFTACALGATVTIDDVATQYASLEEALAAITEAGASSAKIVLAADATIGNIEFENPTEIVLDLMGKTITGTNTSGIDAIIAPNGNFTLTDSSESKTGRIVVDENATIGDGFDSVAAISLMNEGNVLIEAGIIDGAVLVSSDYPSTFSISGGKFLASANTAEQEGEGEGTDEEVTEADANAETDTPTDTTETTAEQTFALADYVVEGKKAELNEAKDYWVIVDDSTPVAKTWADYLGEADTEDGAYKIDDATDFAQFAKGVADGLATKDVTFKLTGNIDLSSSTREDGSTTIGIGVQNAKDMVNQATVEKVKVDNPDYTNIFVKAAFQGTFDGQNYTISGVILPRTDYAGLFMSAYGATIKNLKVSLGNATGFATGDDNCGGGVIAGVTVNTTIENCETVVAGEFNTFSSNKGMGGIVGYAGGGTTLSNCVNNLNITSTGNEKVGGLIACAEDGYHPSAAGYTGRVIENCTNNGAVTCGASDKVWAAGFVSYASGAVTFKGTCAQNGAVTGTGTKSVQYSIISPNKAGLVTVDADAVITTTQTGLLSSKQTVDGLNFATTDSGSKATFKFNSAAVNGANLKIMASGATVTLATAGDKITLDESLATATVSVADSLKETYTTEKTEGESGVNTYTVKAIVWTITYYDDATEPAQFATDTYSVENRAEKTLNAGTRDGYTFKGWKVSATAEIFVGDDYLKTATGNVSLYGIWEEAAPAVEPVEPGSETACADETSATTEAAAINNAKTTMIKVPEIDSLSTDDAKATFCNLFTATVVTSGEGEAKTYSVKVDLDPTADGVKAIQKVIDEIAKPDEAGAVKLDLTKLATETQKATIAAQPGLYYTVYAGEDTPATLDAVKSTQATTATLELEFPKKGTRGFYKIGVSAKEVSVTAAAQ